MERVTFNGVNLSARFVIADIKRPLPEFRDTSSTVEGMDGEFFDALTVGPRECSFSVVAAHKSASELQTLARELMALMTVRKPSALTFSDEVDKDGFQLTRYAVPTGSLDAEEFIKAGRWTFTFKQHDPYLYGKQRSVVLKANAAQKVEIGGNAECYPTATSYASGSYYKLSSGNYSVRFDGPLSGLLTVDFAAQKVSNASSSAAGLHTGSRFFAFSGTMVLTASHQTTLKWRERWL